MSVFMSASGLEIQMVAETSKIMMVADIYETEEIVLGNLSTITTSQGVSDICYDPVNDRIFSVYEDNNIVYGRVGTLVNDTTITFGAEKQIIAFNVNFVTAVYDVQSGNIVVGCSTIGDCFAIVVEIAGDTFNVGGSTELDTVQSQYITGVYNTQDDKTMLVYLSNTSAILVKTISVSGLTATVESSVGVGLGRCDYLDACYDPNYNRLIVIADHDYSEDYAGEIVASQITNNGLTIIPGNIQRFESGFRIGAVSCAYDTVQNRVLIAYETYNKVNGGAFALSAELNDTTFIFGNKLNFDVNGRWGIESIYDPIGTFIVSYSEEIDSGGFVYTVYTMGFKIENEEIVISTLRQPSLYDRTWVEACIVKSGQSVIADNTTRIVNVVKG